MSEEALKKIPLHTVINQKNVTSDGNHDGMA